VGTTVLVLKLIGPNRYALFGPKGNQISSVFHGQKHMAKEWARIYVTSWHNWSVDYKEIEDEETSGVSDTDIRPS
jgi:hypothetical protein